MNWDRRFILFYAGWAIGWIALIIGVVCFVVMSRFDRWSNDRLLEIGTYSLLCFGVPLAPAMISGVGFIRGSLAILAFHVVGFLTLAIGTAGATVAVSHFLHETEWDLLATHRSWFWVAFPLPLICSGAVALRILGEFGTKLKDRILA